jgi:hypothetical protein
MGEKKRVRQLYMTSTRKTEGFWWEVWAAREKLSTLTCGNPYPRAFLTGAKGLSCPPGCVAWLLGDAAVGSARCPRQRLRCHPARGGGSGCAGARQPLCVLSRCGLCHRRRRRR